MKKRVLIVIDGSKRELFGCLMLAQYLYSMGIRPIICSIFVFPYYYARYSPEGIIFPNPVHNLSKFAENSHIFILPSESGNGQYEQVMTNFGGGSTNPIYPECIDKFFCWGKAMKDILLESNRWRDKQLIITGSPSTDHWFLPSVSHETGVKRIGITTTFRALSNTISAAKMNYFQWLDEAERKGGDGTYYLTPEHAEAWLFFEASLARVIVGLSRELSSTRQGPIEIRPHPFERPCRYNYIKRISGGRIIINKKGTISDWLENKFILFTYTSASALDAVIRKIPVVSLKGLLDPDAVRKVPKQFRYSYDDLFWQVTDFLQVLEYVDLAAKGELALCRNEKKFNEFMAEHFFFPREYPAAKLIAMEISDTLRQGTGRRYYSSNHDAIGNRVKTMVMKMMKHVLIPPFLQLIVLLRYILGLFPGQMDIGYSFQPWRFWETASVRKAVKRIQLSTNEKKY